MKGTILLVDDDIAFCKLLKRVLEEEYTVQYHTNPLEALELLKKKKMDLVILDLYMPQMDGIEFLETLRAASPNQDVLFMTAYAGVEKAVEAMKKGAADYLIKPFQNDELRLVVRNMFGKKELLEENRVLREELNEINRPQKIIGKSRKMTEVYEIIKKVGALDSTVLITGESGTGKELAAHAIHHEGARKNRRFVPVNCSAIPESLLESELFGHTKGAFSGAQSARPGLFKYADKGSLLLDEIGDISLPVQAKLLRVIQEQKIRSVGDEEEKEIDVRIILATSRDLKKMIANKEFREDLYYRINVVPLNLPPLRERADDIPLLVNHFIEKFGRSVKTLSEEAMQYLVNYPWPGNVRELQNIVERMLIMAAGENVGIIDLPSEVAEYSRCDEQPKTESYAERKKAMLVQFNKRTVIEALAESGGNVTRAAAALYLERASFQRLMKICGIKSEEFRD
ncbi:MAG: sigma-54 dependent transcriptional regulator [Syntrophales bacterium]|nr:sigma-54 dependent transcriptional regulator [Syntrophales bacterium]